MTHSDKDGHFLSEYKLSKETIKNIPALSVWPIRTYRVKSHEGPMVSLYFNENYQTTYKSLKFSSDANASTFIQKLEEASQSLRSQM